MNWLSWLWRHLDDLNEEIRQQLGREADDGDLLIALGSATDSLTGRALPESGVDLDTLARAVNRLRPHANQADLLRKAEAVRQQKEQALEVGDSETADRLRQEERRLSRESETLHLDALNEIRRRIGLEQRRGGSA